MLTSSFLDWRMIDLKSSTSGESRLSSDSALLVEVHPNHINFNGKPVSIDYLQDKIISELTIDPDQTIFVKVDEGLLLQRAIDVLDNLVLIGASNLSLVRESSN